MKTLGKTKPQLPPQVVPPILVKFWLDRHFELLCKMGRAKETIKRLRIAAVDRGFYDRIKPRETFEKYPIPTQLTPSFA